MAHLGPAAACYPTSATLFSRAASGAMSPFALSRSTGDHEGKMAANNRDHFAIIIGINKYPQLPPLDSAVDDARRFARWLLEVGGLEDDHIEIIESPDP